MGANVCYDSKLYLNYLHHYILVRILIPIINTIHTPNNIYTSVALTNILLYYIPLLTLFFAYVQQRKEIATRLGDSRVRLLFKNRVYQSILQHSDGC